MPSSTRILIVDDQEAQRKTLSIALRLDGFDVACAACATDALESLSDGHFDLALVDLMMPGINGLELARQLRTLFPTVKVVLTSAYHLSERQLRRAECGAVGFVPKPYQMSELVDFLRTKATS
jgi:CheY-like chemotaxis protein